MEIQFRRTGVCLTCLIWAFLDMEGYEIDEEIMLDHAQSILAYYAGDGWYRDGHSFDYYSCWAFNVLCTNMEFCGMAMRSSRISQQSLRSTPIN